MRMWMISPQILCDKHLNGEHYELHKHRHSFVKGHDMTKRVVLNQIEPRSMGERHDVLAEEINRRAEEKGTGGHQSPYEQPDLSHYPDYIRKHKVDTDLSLLSLLDRCEDCFARWEFSERAKDYVSK